MRAKALFIISLIILSFPALAGEADIQKAYNWLLAQPVSDVFTASLTALAISLTDQSQAQPYLTFIKNSCCFSTNSSCSIRE